MRKTVKLFLIFSISFFFSSQAVASDSYFGNSSEKLVSGLTNAVTGWIELPKNIVLTSQTEGPLYGATIGVSLVIPLIVSCSKQKMAMVLLSGLQRLFQKCFWAYWPLSL